MRKADTAWSKYRVEKDIKLLLILITFPKDMAVKSKTQRESYSSFLFSHLFTWSKGFSFLTE